MTTMPPALEAHLRSMSDNQRKRLAADSRKALRIHWPHRNTNRRDRSVVTANVRMLRNLAAL